MRAYVEPHLQPGDLERIHRPLDWLGINHYSPVYVKADPEAMMGFNWGDRPADLPLTQIEWPIDAPAFRDTLLKVSQRYGLPVYVTENGYGGNRCAGCRRQGS